MPQAACGSLGLRGGNERPGRWQDPPNCFAGCVMPRIVLITMNDLTTSLISLVFTSYLYEGAAGYFTKRSSGE